MFTYRTRRKKVPQTIRHNTIVVSINAFDLKTSGSRKLSYRNLSAWTGSDVYGAYYQVLKFIISDINVKTIRDSIESKKVMKIPWFSRPTQLLIHGQ